MPKNEGRLVVMSDDQESTSIRSGDGDPIENSEDESDGK